MQRYVHYQSSLDDLLTNSCWGRKPVSQSDLQTHLNGGASASLRELVSRSQIRRSGAFFTGEELSRRVVEAAIRDKSEPKAAWDPTCGAGDLLLRWSEKLPIFDDLRATLDLWGKCLHGQDIHSEFVTVAKRRLTLAAIGRGSFLKRGNITGLDRWFPNIRQRSLLDGKLRAPKATVILMNPPFTMIATPTDCQTWSSGRVAFSAVAFLRCLAAADPGQRISAILPDVLRSGSRYTLWRERIEKSLINVKVDVVGKFSAYADVDVFVLDGEIGTHLKNRIEWFAGPTTASNRTLDAICDIHVGTVVPHRHFPAGKLVPYLTTPDSPPWGELANIKAKRQFAGVRVSGPFLAIRRTSSPSDNSRAVTTLVSAKQRVALENHLISVRPFDGSIQTCRRLMEHLHSSDIRRWLDQRIRCRHLTVTAIKQLPLPKDL